MSTSKKRLEYIDSWKEEKTDLIRFRVPKGKKDEYMALAEKEGKSLTAYIIDTLAEKIGKEKGED